MDKSELDYLRGEYELMDLSVIEEMISYGPKEYEPEVWSLLQDIAKSKQDDSTETVSEEISEEEQAADQEHMIDGYIPLLQTQSQEEADKLADKLDEDDIDYYFEPFQAGLIRTSDPCSFIVVKVAHFQKAAELLLPLVPDAKLRS